jgi:hypothetical protein
MNGLATTLVTASALSVVGSILAWVGVVLGSLLLLLVLVPLHARAAGRVTLSGWSGWAELRWGFGLLKVRLDRERGAGLYLVGLRIYRLRRRPQRPKKPREKKQGAGFGENLRWFLRHRATLIRLVRRLLRALHLRARLEGVAGLGDPTDTALLFQGIWALKGRRLELRITPDWLDENLALQGTARSWVWPAELLGVLLGAYLRKETRTALRTAPSGA